MEDWVRGGFLFTFHFSFFLSLSLFSFLFSLFSFLFSLFSFLFSLFSFLFSLLSFLFSLFSFLFSLLFSFLFLFFVFVSVLVLGEEQAICLFFTILILILYLYALILCFLFLFPFSFFRAWFGWEWLEIPRGVMSCFCYFFSSVTACIKLFPVSLLSTIDGLTGMSKEEVMDDFMRFAARSQLYRRPATFRSA